MSGITPQKPTSIWKRPVKVKFGDLAMSLGKTAIAGAFGQWPEVASGGVDILSALGIQGNEVAAIAWLLVQRSLLQAMSELTQESKQELNDEPDFKRLCQQLDDALANNELSLEPNFFTKPKQLPMVAQVQAPFRQWLQSLWLIAATGTGPLRTVALLFCVCSQRAVAHQCGQLCRVANGPQRSL
jgi:hypothetical protein